MLYELSMVKPKPANESMQSSIRAANMAKRRELIVSHARTVIAAEGYDALKLRDLAARAGVTVPTIYNLIGGKADVLALIIDELVDRLLVVQQDSEGRDIEFSFEAQINDLATLMATDESYFRAAFIAGDRSGLFGLDSASGIYARSVKLPITTCKQAQAVGLLKGTVSAEQMGRQIYGCYRLARQDWTNGYFELEAFRVQALTGVFLCLAADASPAFHTRLMSRIAALK